MPPRRRSGTGSSPEHLTAENLEALAAAVAEGKRATVYLREATQSLGIEAGCSAKVVSVEGNTVVIRPKGVNDELPFEAEELRMTRKAPEPVAARKAPVRPAPSVTPARAVPPVKPAAAAPSVKSAAAAPSVKSAAAAPSVEPEPAAPPAARAAQPPTTRAQAPASSSASASRRAKKPQGGVSVTIHAGADNDWTVTVALGAKRPSKAVPVTPDAVDRAVRELGDPAALEAVRSVISAAREAAEERVAALSRELEDARRTLEALGSTT